MVAAVIFTSCIFDNCTWNGDLVGINVNAATHGFHEYLGICGTQTVSGGYCVGNMKLAVPPKQTEWTEFKI